MKRTETQPFDPKHLTCLMCGAPMKLIERISNGKNKAGKPHRRRRMKCSVCDYQELLHASGERDIKQKP